MMIILIYYILKGKNEQGEETTHYVYIKDFSRLMYNFYENIKVKSIFVCIAYNVFIQKKV